MNQYEQFQQQQGIQQSQPYPNQQSLTTSQEGALDWNSNIVKESAFILLPDGDYDFIVNSFDREHYEGGDNLSACNVAVLNIRIDTNLHPDGYVIIKHRLFLHTKTEWALSAFFRAIGQKKKDAPLQMNWNLVPGSKGRLRLGKKIYKDNEYNEIKKFYPADEQQPQPYTPQTTAGFTPGQF